MHSLKKVRLVFIPVLFYLGLFGNTGHTQSVSAVITAQDNEPQVADTVIMALQFDMTNMPAPDSLLGGFTVGLGWNPAVIEYLENTGLQQGFFGVVNEDSSQNGILIFNGINPFGVTGGFEVLEVKFLAIGSPASSTTLTADIPSLAAALTFRDLTPFLNISTIQIAIAPTVGVSPADEEYGLLPEGFLLEQNYPNPFNPATTIAFVLSKRGHVEIRLFDALGRSVKTLANSVFASGSHKINLDTAGLSSGNYFYTMSFGATNQIRKMTLIR